MTRSHRVSSAHRGHVEALPVCLAHEVGQGRGIDLQRPELHLERLELRTQGWAVLCVNGLRQDLSADVRVDHFRAINDSLLNLAIDNHFEALEKGCDLLTFLGFWGGRLQGT